MSEPETNIVISGKYHGSKVNYKTILDKEYVYVGNNVYFAKENVKSIITLNSNTDNESLKGGLLFGTVGAIVGSSIYNVLIKVIWQSDEESIIKVSSGLYAKIQTASYMSLPPEENHKIGTVVAGKYANPSHEIKTISHFNTFYAYLEKENIWLSNDNVKSIDIINEKVGENPNYSSTTKLLGYSDNDILIKITWSDGEESIVVAKSSMYNYILETYQKPNSSLGEIIMQEKEEENPLGKIIIPIIIGIIWLFIYLISGD